MDDFMEKTASPRSGGLHTLLYVLAWISIVVLGLVALFFLVSVVSFDDTGFHFQPISLIIALVTGGAAFLAWRRADYCLIEYDYTFTNGTLDVSMILNQRKRRYLTALEMKDVIACGPVNSQGFKRRLNDKTLTVRNWFCNRDANLSYFIFEKKGAKQMAVMEIDRELLTLMTGRRYLDAGIWSDDSGRTVMGA